MLHPFYKGDPSEPIISEIHLCSSLFLLSSTFSPLILTLSLVSFKIKIHKASQQEQQQQQDTL